MVSVRICENLDEIRGLREAYLCSLRGPQEAWLEEQVHVRDTDFHVFVDDGRRIGYRCVDGSKRLLLQFYVSEEFSGFSVEAFESMLGETGIRRAYVTTRDPLALSLCLTFQKSVALESFLFEHRFATDISLQGIPSSQFRLVDHSDAAKIREVSGDFYGDVESEIKSKHLYVLTAGEDLLGIGYLSTRFCNIDSANLGMYTNPSFRRRSVGSYLLQKLVEECRANGLVPIAACYHENPESKRTLEKAGFVSYDRTLLVSF
jgi:GNAT superfamily N-acetyltransferase